MSAASVRSGNVFTTGMISKMLHVAPRTVSLWCDRGLLQSYRLPGSNDRRVTRKSLVLFFRENAVPVPAELLPDVLPGLLVVTPEARIGETLASLLKGTMRVDCAAEFFGAGKLYGAGDHQAILIDFAVGLTPCIDLLTRADMGENAPLLYALTCEDTTVSSKHFEKTWERETPLRDIAQHLHESFKIEVEE